VIYVAGLDLTCEVAAATATSATSAQTSGQMEEVTGTETELEESHVAMLDHVQATSPCACAAAGDADADIDTNDCVNNEAKKHAKNDADDDTVTSEFTGVDPDGDSLQVSHEVGVSAASDVLLQTLIGEAPACLCIHQSRPFLSLAGLA
jgi:hypothetical protein